MKVPKAPAGTTHSRHWASLDRHRTAAAANALIHSRDPFGNPIRLQHESSAAALAGFVEGFLGYTPRILEVLAAAEDDASAIVQACAAALWMFSESPLGPPAARRHLERAKRAALPCTEREQLFAMAIASWVEGDLKAALTAHDALADQHPRDLASVKLGQYHAFNGGDAPSMLRLALKALPAAADIAWLHGMAAFGWEQCHRLDQAEAAASRALAMRPGEPWAQHALAHVMLSDGRLREGAAFMQAASPGWQALTSFMRSHNWWHLALFLIELGDDSAALALYDSQVWGVDKSYSQDQVGAVSLLARLELAGLDVGDRWNELAAWLAGRAADQVLPFLDMQYLYGLARAGRPEADVLMANVERFASGSPELLGTPWRAVAVPECGNAAAAASRNAAATAWRNVAVPACRGLLAHARGGWLEAAQQLALALPQLSAIGGSHAQRELFEQIYIDAMQRLGQLAGVQNLLQPRANAQPQSLRLRRRLREVCAGLDLPALAPG